MMETVELELLKYATENNPDIKGSLNLSHFYEPRSHGQCNLLLGKPFPKKF